MSYRSHTLHLSIFIYNNQYKSEKILNYMTVIIISCTKAYFKVNGRITKSKFN